VGYLRRFAPGDTQVWASLDEMDGDHTAGIDHPTTLDGSHSEKLNELARRICETAPADDHLLFLDGDAFPIAPLAPSLASPDELVAVRRDENRGDRQPHPCFTVTTVGFWTEIGGDWSLGYVSDAGAIDIGGRLLRALDDGGRAWRPLTRRNTVDLHPLWFGVYGDDELGPVVYHHGAGFRPRVDRADRAPKPARIAASVPVLGRAERSLRWRLRQRRIEGRTYQRPAEAQDAAVWEWIEHDDNIADRFVTSG
jgi:hypothetical protein